MQTITTKYLSQTNCKPTRIKATTTSGKSITMSVESIDYFLQSFTDENRHSYIAVKLRNKMGWSQEMVGGNLKDGIMVWVFVDGPKLY